MKAPASVAALVAIALGLSAWVGSTRANAGEPSSGALPRSPEHRPAPTTGRSSRLVLGGSVRCTATVRSPVQVGHAVSVRFAFRNVSKHPVEAVLDAGLVLKAADGTTYDPSVPLAGLPRPPPVPIKILPGANKTERLDTLVRWRGPLRITPECGQATLPVLHVDVSASGPPPAASTAVADVVAASGHLLDQCRPQAPGVAVYGQIYPPSGSAPPMSAECSVSLDSQGAFWVAQALVLTPPGLPGVTIQQPYEIFAPPYSVFSPPVIPPPYEAIAWQFVVTRDGARSVAAAMTDASNPSGQTAPSWDWNGTAWRSGGIGSCGGRTWAWGTRPTIEFISVCPS